jgi:hypothetical protein
MSPIQNFYEAAKLRNHYLTMGKDSTNSPSVQAHAKGKWEFFKKSKAKDVLGAFRQTLKREKKADFFKRLPPELRLRLENLEKGGKGVRRIIREVEAFDLQDQEKIRSNESYLEEKFTALNFKAHLSSLFSCRLEELPHPLDSFDDSEFIAMQAAMKEYLKSNYVGVMPELKLLPVGDAQRIFEQALNAAMSERLSQLKLTSASPEANPLHMDPSAQRHAASYGLSAWKNEPEDIAYGRRQLAPQDAGRKKGTYSLAGSKLSGVEPGFVARKVWTDADTQKLLDPKHPFALRAVGVLLENLPDAKLEQLAVELGMMWDAVAWQDRKELLSRIRKLPFEQVVNSVTVAEAFNQLGQDWKQNKLSPRDGSLLKLMISFTENTEAKLSRHHYIKLDYHETLLGKYTIAPRAHVSSAQNLGHQMWRRQSPRDINFSAITEAMANDITRSFGIFTQKLKLVHAHYPDGSPKLLLDGTHMYDPDHTTDAYADLDTQMYATSRRNEGVLLKTSEPDQSLGVDTSIKQLGYNKIFLLGLADADAVGSKGQNKGRLGNQFASIDPGKSLNAKAMDKKDLRNDMAVKPGDYKNFSIFDQSPFSERMAGVRDLVKTLDNYPSSAQEKIFTDYDNAFGVACTNKELRFTREINAIREGYRNRLAYIKAVFADRLAVYEWTLPDQPEVNHEANQTFHARTLDSLDMLEKISSKGVKLKDGHIELAQPTVPYGDRQEWQVKPHATDPDSLVFSPVNGHPKAAMTRVKDFMKKVYGDNWREQFKDSGITLGSSSGNAEDQLIIRKDQMQYAADAFSVAALRDYLGQ